MKLNFNINYQTVYGEQLVLNIQENGKNIQYRMNTADGERWTCHINKQRLANGTVLEYFYSVDCDGSQQRQEWLTEPHRLEINIETANNYNIYDRWISMPEDSYLYSSAFTDCVNRRHSKPLKVSAFNKTVRMKVRAPQLHVGESLAVIGSCESLGLWDIAKAVKMTEHNYNEWSVDVDASPFMDQEVEFKFAVINDNWEIAPVWETGNNRTVNVPGMLGGEVVVYELDQAFFPFSNSRLAGTLVPVFSLRSEGSFGVGDFGDLNKMVDYVASTGQRVLQVLPINDSTVTHTWTDSYPYSCISIFALHPMYADLRQLPALKDADEAKRFHELQKQLNLLSQIDYEAVNNAKQEYMKLLFAQEGKAMMQTDEYKKFFDESQEWLVPYAQYCYLRDTNGTADFSKWQDHNQWDEADRRALCNSRSKAFRNVEFYYFVQFILNIQMQAVHEHACQKNIILKGDIPIGVNRHGCDVWMEPGYFNMNSQAGAPPDGFSVNGQNWGFPTYNWDAMLADGCQWWVRRFRNMQKFFDAYRIDHVLGFFRIWDIPIESVHGLLGQFSPSLGMSREEIESYGLRFQEYHFTHPFIAEWMLDRMFDADTKQQVKHDFLVHTHDDVYNLKPEFNTQRKIESFFEGKTSPEAMAVRDSLYALVSNVLFIRDRKDENLFHPRITAQLSFVYEALWDSDKEPFNRLYNDYYYRRNNQFWYREAAKKLPNLVQATRMLVCAEDLGMVPDCVPWIMDEHKILSLEIQSMPKDPKVRFGYLSRNPYRSVSTISTHDMPTLRQWWDEDYERTQDYFNNMLHQQGPAPHPMPGWVAREIVSQHLSCPSMLCIISLQDWMAIDENLRLADANAERINIPANPKHYWRYRMHITLEELMQNNDFCNNVRQLVNETGRG